MTQRNRVDAGITTIECLILVAACALGLLIYAVHHEAAEKAPRVLAARLQIQQFVKALELFRQDNGFYPATEEGLAALVRKPERATNWKPGGYLDQLELPKDPWNHDYHYTAPGEHNRNYEIRSLGADGKEGGDGFDADLANYDDY